MTTEAFRRNTWMLVTSGVFVCTVTARAEVPPYCEVLTQSTTATVSVTANNTGWCTVPQWYSSHEQVECGPDRQLHVEVSWNQTPATTESVLRCVLANPEAAEGEVYISCIPNAPAGCIVELDSVEAFVDQSPVEVPPGSVRCGWEMTGVSHPREGTTFVEDANGLVPGDQPAYVPNLEYCQGLVRAPGSIAAPWGQERCCREQYDVVFAIDAQPGVTLMRFIMHAPLAALGQGDWRFAVPSCGDGIRHCHEECDDGNDEDLDACSSTCHIQQWTCGAPVNPADGPKASDALYVLRKAVGVSPCGCVCDVDGSGVTSASDALAVLRATVGGDTEFSCSRCVINEDPGGGTEHFGNWCIAPRCELGFGYEHWMTDNCILDGSCEPTGRCNICDEADLARIHPTLEQCEAEPF